MYKLSSIDVFTQKPTGDNVWWDGKQLTNRSGIPEAVIQLQSAVIAQNHGHELVDNRSVYIEEMFVRTRRKE